MQRNWGLYRDLCTCCQREGLQHDNNLLWIFSCQKRFSGSFYTKFVQSGTIVNKGGNLHFEMLRQYKQGRQLTFWVVLRQYTPLITQSSIAICSTLLSICSLQRWGLSPFILCLVLICFTDSEHYSNLFHFQTNIYNGLVFENATHFPFLSCYLKILFVLTDGCN